MNICEYCEESFSTIYNLNRHKRTSLTCLRYRDILFTCKKCDYTCIGIKCMERHTDNCDGISILEEYKNTRNNRMELELKIEKLKNKIYKQIIEQKLGIVLDDIFNVENPAEIHIKDTDGLGIGLIVHNFIEEDKKYTLTSQKPEMVNKPDTIPVDISINKSVNKPVKKPRVLSRNQNPEDSDGDIILPKSSKKSDKKSDIDEPEKKGQYYRSITQVDTVPEKTPEEIAVGVSIVQDNTDRVLHTFNVEDKHTILSRMDEYISSIEQNNRVYNKNLDLIRKERIKLLFRVPVEKYIQLVEEHNGKLKNIFSAKGYNEKKINGLIVRGLSPLEQRLIFYPGYENTQVEIDDLQILSKAQSINILYPQDFVPLNKTDIFIRFSRYDSALLPIQENMEKYMINRFGFPNIVYVNLPKSNQDDPYSFYIFERYSDGKRYWKMDCRLESLATDFIACVRFNMVTLFRKIYYTIFQDNEYRKDYTTKNQVTEYDCEQLLRNIFYQSDTMSLMHNMCTFFREKATYTPTVNDKFNLQTDDPLLKKKISAFRKAKRHQEDIEELVASLFDNICPDDIKEFIRSKDFIRVL